MQSVFQRFLKTLWLLQKESKKQLFAACFPLPLPLIGFEGSMFIITSVTAGACLGTYETA